MPKTDDYAQALECLRRVVGTLDEARLTAGRANMPYPMTAQSVLSQIDAVDTLLGLAQADVDAARQACTAAGRAQFRVID